MKKKELKKLNKKIEELEAKAEIALCQVKELQMMVYWLKKASLWKIL